MYTENGSKTPVPDRFTGSLLLNRGHHFMGRMISQGALLDRTRDIQRKPEWVVKGLYFTSDCFRCAHKIKYEFKGFKVRILCSDNCNYTPAQS